MNLSVLLLTYGIFANLREALESLKICFFFSKILKLFLNCEENDEEK